MVVEYTLPYNDLTFSLYSNGPFMNELNRNKKPTIFTKAVLRAICCIMHYFHIAPIGHVKF